MAHQRKLKINLVFIFILKKIILNYGQTLEVKAPKFNEEKL